MTFATLAMQSGTLALGAPSQLDALFQSGGLLNFASGGTITGNVVQNAGTLENHSGSLVLEEGGDLGGFLAGAGAIELCGPARTFTFEPGLVLSNATLDIDRA